MTKRGEVHGGTKQNSPPKRGHQAFIHSFPATEDENNTAVRSGFK